MEILRLCGKNLEVTEPKNLLSRLAIFIIEFEYDNRIYIGHACGITVQNAIKKFINSCLDESVSLNEILKVSAKNSNTFYITINDLSDCSKDELFKLKYEAIVKNKSYEPFGFNSLIPLGNRCEEDKKYLKETLGTLGNSYSRIKTSTSARSIIEYARTPESNKFIAYKEWSSISEAALFYRVKASNIAACCSGRLHTAYGRVWKYSDNYDKDTEFIIKGKVPRPIYQYDRNTGLLIRSFKSVEEAVKDTGIYATNINKCCNNRLKSAGGYVWSYELVKGLAEYEDKRRKESISPTKEELAKRIQEKQLAFISKNFKTKEQQAEEEKYKVTKKNRKL